MMKVLQFLMWLSISTLILSCKQSSKDFSTNQIQSTEGMLQHNVYFYLKDSVSDKHKNEFENGLQKLLLIDVIHNSEMGKTGATKAREVADHEFDYSIFTWFKSMEDYEVYADHPDHMEFIDNYQHLWADIKVYDSEIINSEVK
ncbi:Dabb family protein [Marivirga sp.]|uniref:Dabb family protein n=1 Tax=Marivirga sp. TaxID=2018662 RepID=UPI0025E1A6D6|nr:Dabb family protein [Marivirga sp.]